MPESVIIRTTLSFSAADSEALAERVRALRKVGVTDRSGTVLRALIYMTPESDLIARCVRLTAALALKGASEPETTDRPTVHLDKAQLKKLDDVVAQLSRANIIATRTFVVRALLLEAPKGNELAELFAAFEKKFPFKARGLSKLRLARKARGSA